MEGFETSASDFVVVIGATNRCVLRYRMQHALDTVPLSSR